MPEKLSEAQVAERLSQLNGWEQRGIEISKSYKLPSFTAALVFVNTVGHLAEAIDHHPDILIKYRTVIFTISTHDAGGLTTNDFDLAAQIDALPMKA